MKKRDILFYFAIFLITIYILPFSGAEETYQEPYPDAYQNITASELAPLFTPLTVPPDPLTQILLDAGIDEFSAQRIKNTLEFALGEFTDAVIDRLRDMTAKELIKDFPASKAAIKKANWALSVFRALEDAGNAYIDYYEATYDPDLSIYDRQTLVNDFASKLCSALASFMPPGVSDVAVGVIKIGYLAAQYNTDEDEAQYRRDMDDLERKNRELQETLYDALNDYGDDQQNKQIIIDVMSNDQVINHVLGQTKGPSGENLQAEPDPSILDFVSGARRTKIYKQMKTAIMDNKLDSNLQTARDLQKKYPVGSGVLIKSSPVYMLITDPFGRHFGVNPETRDIICESEAVFCAPLFTHYDTQMVTTPALYEGRYEVKLFGFDKGKFVFSFMGISNSYVVESNQDIEGYIKKGQVLTATIDIERTDDSFKVSKIIFNESGTFIPGPKASEVPFKVISISPGPGRIFRTEKPVIKIGFNKPVSENNELASLTVLKDSGGNAIKGMVLAENTHLSFIPAKPLAEGNYSIKVNDWSDKYGLRLSNSMNSSFTVVRNKKDGLRYSLSYPVIYNITSFIKLKNAGNSRIHEIKVKDVLFQDSYPNVFVKYVGSSIEPEISKDSYGNTWGTWEVDSLDSKEEKIIDYTFLVLIFNVNYFDYMNFEKVSGSETVNEEFIKPSDCIESNDNIIQKTAREIAGSSANAYEKAQKIYYWLTKNIGYQYKGEGEAGGALQTLNTKQGVCHSFSCLNAALLRNLGVPTKYILVTTWSLNQTQRHASNEFYLQGIGWLPVDATWGTDVNDWFLASGTDHIRLGELKPPVTDWSSYSGNGLEIDWGTVTFRTIEPSALWDNNLKILYNSVGAVDFKKRFIELLPTEIESVLSNNSSVSFNVSYVYHRKPFPELSNSLDSEMLAVQNVVDQYFKGQIEPGVRTDLEMNTQRIYSGLIEEIKREADDSKLEFVELSEKSQEYYKSLGLSEEEAQGLDSILAELEAKGFEVVTNMSSSINLSANYSQIGGMFGGFELDEIEINFWAQNITLPLPHVLERINQSIMTSEKKLKQKDYDGVKEQLLSTTGYLSAMEQTKMLLNFDVFGLQSFDAPLENAGYSGENISYFGNNSFSLPSPTGKEISFAIFALIISFIFLILIPILGIWMFFHCLIRKEVRHMNKFLWILIIIFIFDIGPILYFILEYLKRNDKKRSEKASSH